MFTITKRELKSNLKSLIFWCIGALLFSGIGFLEYGVVKNVDMDYVTQMMPRIVRVMMGFDKFPINTPEGFFCCLFVWLSLLVFLHAALLGANIITKEERDKTADFLFTKPVRRNKILIAKTIAAFLNIFVLCLICYLTTLISFLPQTGKGTAGYITISFLGMLIVQIIFLSLGLFVAAAVRDHKKAAAYSAAAVLVFYFAYVLILMTGMDFLNFLSPFLYFDASIIIADGFPLLYLIPSILVTCTALFFVFRLYGKRNLKN